MLEAIRKAGLKLPTQYPDKWVVDCRSVGTGEKALTYLGNYLYRGVLQEKDIVACNNGKVTFRFKNSKRDKMELRTVTGPEFLWLLMQPVLPKGFRRARNFGFLHPNSKPLIALLHLLLKINPLRLLATKRERPQIICDCCGAEMIIVQTQIVREVPSKTKAGENPLLM